MQLIAGSVHHRHEKEKRQAYEQRVREVEHVSFAPLQFAASGGIGKVALTVTYMWIVSLITTRTVNPTAR